MHCSRIFYTCFYVWLCLEVFATRAKAEFCFDGNNEGRSISPITIERFFLINYTLKKVLLSP
jgi:hypothetical protein